MDSDKLFDQIFEFKMMAKQFAKESQKAENKKTATTAKIKTAIEKNQMDLARNYGQEAIRYQNEAKRYKALSSKIDAVHSKLTQAYKTKQLNDNIKSLVGKMANACNISDVTKMMETMDTFEKMFDNMDVTDKMMNDVFDNVNAGTVNDMEVNKLIDAIQEKEGLKVDDNMINPNYNNPMGQKVSNKQQGQALPDNYFP